MSLIKIIANNIDLDFVSETLSIKKENNALIRDFRVFYSSVPFLILENTKTLQALGQRELTSLNKIKTISVKVIEAGISYSGELQIISYLKGSRKCNLKYASELSLISNKKISDFMPIVSVIPGETSPEPFTEKSSAVITGYEDWETYPISFLNSVFPAVKWQFPTMKWQNKFGENLASDDTWFLYNNEINKYNDDYTAIIENTYSIDGSGIITVANKNVVSPQIFLLTPLFYAVESIGWKIQGDFYSDEFIKRLLFLSTKTNLTEVSLLGTINTISFTGIDWDPTGTLFTTFQKKKIFAITETGTYTIYYSFTYDGPVSSHFPTNGLLVAAPGDSAVQYVFSFPYLSADKTFSGEIELNANEIGSFLFIIQSIDETMPTSYTLTLQKKDARLFQEMHPTIELGRFLPDWSFGTYINELKNFFNLDVQPIEETKTLSINFNEDEIKTNKQVTINQSLVVNNYDPIPRKAFLLILKKS